uniref:Fatty acyl-CoA reductase C-terminal domain-containing protein n=1 Tax=Timema cristinae TaxID=61476 RepID=A0A7R9CNG3_TIMCR|nr:unnamed protein product [Timema cristinae]
MPSTNFGDIVNRPFSVAQRVLNYFGDYILRPEFAFVWRRVENTQMKLVPDLPPHESDRIDHVMVKHDEIPIYNSVGDNSYTFLECEKIVLERILERPLIHSILVPLGEDLSKHILVPFIGHLPPRNTSSSSGRANWRECKDFIYYSKVIDVQENCDQVREEDNLAEYYDNEVPDLASLSDPGKPVMISGLRWVVNLLFSLQWHTHLREMEDLGSSLVIHAIKVSSLEKERIIVLATTRVHVGEVVLILKIYRKIDNYLLVVRYFSTFEWNFNNNKCMSLFNSLCENDKEIFYFDASKLNYKDYLLNTIDGIRRYIFKESDDTIPAGKVRLMKFYIAHQTIKVVLYGLIAWILWSVALRNKDMNCSQRSQAKEK